MSETNRKPEEDAAEDRGTVGAATPPPELPDAYAIPRALAQATLDYLARQPYREVVALVQAYEQLKPLPSELDRDSDSAR